MAELFQTINVHFALGAVVINVAFGVLILTRTSRTGFYRIFLFICVSAATWNFGIFMTYFAGKGFWFYFALVGSPMMPALLFHFICALVPAGPGRSWIGSAYGLSALLSASSLAAMISETARRFVDGILWNVYFLTVLLPFVIAGVILLRRGIKDSVSAEEKARFRSVLYATMIAAGMGLTDLIQIFHVPVPKLGHAGSVIYPSILAVGLFKYRRTYDIMAQLQLKLELLSAMATGIAHEIRNPLSSVKGAAKLLRAATDRTGDESAREYADVITEELARIDTILANFQQLTRPIAITKEPVAINDVLDRTVKLAETGVVPLRMTLDLAAGLPLVPADASALKQVFLNLIMNAAAAGGGNGTLLITTARTPRGVSIRFRDRGVGIPPESLERIFEPFYTTKGAGMGLGLSICRRIVLAHAGRIEARNAHPAGAEFNIFLPL